MVDLDEIYPRSEGVTAMGGIEDALVIAGMFILRLGVPLAITLAVGYALLRLDRK